MSSTAQVNTLTDLAGTGAPNAPYGIKLAGGSALAYYSPWTLWTPTFIGLGTVAVNLFYARVVGDTLEVNGTFTCGTPTATPCKIVFPGGTTINSAKIASGAHNTFEGQSFIMRTPTNNIYASAGNAPVLFFDGSTLDGLFFAIQTTTGAFIGANGNTIFSPGDVVNMRIFGLPIS